MANSAKLAATNEDLVGIVKKLSKEIKNLERETYRLKKTGDSGASKEKMDTNLCTHCNKVRLA